MVFSTARADWALKDDANTDLPGRKVDITQDGVLRARLIYGEGQIKPYLRVQGEEGDGLNEWSDKQTYPHHRGIYIGWNKIVSDLGSFDLWHMNNGGRMTLVKLEKLEGGKDSATIVSTIEWRGGKKDAGGGDLLLTETRTLTVSRPAAQTTQVDAQFVLKSSRDLTLGGDLQHAGVHFRASASVQARAKANTLARRVFVSSSSLHLFMCDAVGSRRLVRYHINCRSAQHFRLCGLGPTAKHSGCYVR